MHTRAHVLRVRNMPCKLYMSAVHVQCVRVLTCELVSASASACMRVCCVRVCAACVRARNACVREMRMQVVRVCMRK